MKKLHILILAYLLSGIALFSLVNWISPTNIHGHFKTLDLARKAVSYYDNAERIHTKNVGEYYVDFLLGDDDNLYIVTIKRYDTNAYNKWDVTAFYTDVKAQECAAHLMETGEIPWEASGAAAKVYWTVLEQSSGTIAPQAEKYEFFIGDTPYTLYIKNG